MTTQEARAAQKRVRALCAEKREELATLERKLRHGVRDEALEKKRAELRDLVNAKLADLEKRRAKIIKTLEPLFAQANKLVARFDFVKSSARFHLRDYPRSTFEVTDYNITLPEKYRGPSIPDRRHALRELQSQLELTLGLPERAKRERVETFLLRAEKAIKAC